MRDCRKLLFAALSLALPAAAGAELSQFGYRSVELLDGPFREASERNARYLLELDPDRLLHNTRKYAGLEPKGALYGGWESAGIAGHTLGHYLTALSQQYAATADARFRERIDYIIAEMAAAQAPTAMAMSAHCRRSSSRPCVRSARASEPSRTRSTSQAAPGCRGTRSTRSSPDFATPGYWAATSRRRALPSRWPTGSMSSPPADGSKCRRCSKSNTAA